jgi:hypothetical protein
VIISRSSAAARAIEASLALLVAAAQFPVAERQGSKGIGSYTVKLTVVVEVLGLDRSRMKLELQLKLVNM